MSIGSLSVKTSDGRESLAPDSVSIVGVQRGFIVDLVVKQVFRHDAPQAKEFSYLVPDNSQICMYDTTFRIGDKVIRPKIEEKKEAERIYDDARNEGMETILASNLPNGLVEFRLGNVPGNTTCEVEVKCGVIAASSGPSESCFKVPLDACTPRGSCNCVAKNVKGDFVFEIRNDDDRVQKIEGSVAGEYRQGCWRASGKPDCAAILVRTTYRTPHESSYVVSGCFMAATIFCVDHERPAPKNNEFVFVVDCSASMSGSNMERARKCLDLFLRSLPGDSFFNVIRFGSKYERMFGHSVEYNEENISHALELCSHMAADLGGTDIYQPLDDLFQCPLKGCGQRQVFILTDGEVYNTDCVLDLVSANAQTNRCFALGIGAAADAGLVEGVANRSGGRSDFVQDDDDFSGKVIPQLDASFAGCITEVDLHIEGCDEIETASYPIGPISHNIASTILVKSRKAFTGRESVLLTGESHGDTIEVSLSPPSSITQPESLSALFAYESIRHLTLILNSQSTDRDRHRELIIGLSKLSGVLCRFTSFVGASDTQYVPDRQVSEGITGPWSPPCGSGESRARPVSAGSGGRRTLCSCMRKIPTRPGSPVLTSRQSQIIESAHVAEASCPEPEKNEPVGYEYSDVVKMQNIAGFWPSDDDVCRLIGQHVEMTAHIRHLNVREDVRPRIFATVLALSLLRNRYAQHQSSWQGIERKALVWLSQQASDVDWQSIIGETSSLI